MSIRTLDPEIISAYYDLAMTLGKSGDAKKGLAWAMKGLDIKKPHDADYFLLMASLCDANKEPKRALEVLKRGLGENSSDATFFQTLGKALLRREATDPAKLAFQKSLLLKPADASTHAFLAMAYGSDFHQLPMALAGGVALLFDPKSDFAKNVRKMVMFSFDGYHAGSPTDEGNFREAERAMAATGPGARMLLGKDADAGVILGTGYQTTIATLIPDLLKKNRKGFASTFYLPFYAGLADKHLEEAFSNRILLGETGGDAAKWLASHPKENSRLDEFIHSYRWPS